MKSESNRLGTASKQKRENDQRESWRRRRIIICQEGERIFPSLVKQIKVIKTNFSIQVNLGLVY